jgi:drug/metabolite transporter (DMT)-like permease
MDQSYLYGIVLLSALGHASWNALLKSTSDRLVLMTCMRCVGMVYGVIALSFTNWPSPNSIPWLVSAAGALWTYQYLLVASYDAGDLSFVYPLARGIAPVLLTGMSYVTIGEALSTSQLSGVFLISTGVVLLATMGRGGPYGFLYAVLTGASIATYSLLSGAGVRASGQILGFAAALEILNGIGVIGYSWAARGRALTAGLKGMGFTGLGAGVVSVAGYLAFLLAASQLPLGPVSAIRECSALFGVAIGVIVLKEGFGGIRMAAAFLMTLGVLLLAVL